MYGLLRTIIIVHVCVRKTYVSHVDPFIIISCERLASHKRKREKEKPQYATMSSTPLVPTKKSNSKKCV